MRRLLNRPGIVRIFLTLLLIAGYSLVPLGSIRAISDPPAEGEKYKLGHECANRESDDNNKWCLSGDCEESDIPDTENPGKNKWFCDCNSIFKTDIGADYNSSCFNEYGPAPDGGKWQCINGGTQAHDIDYCQSTRGTVKYAIEPTNPDRTDVLLRPGEAGPALLNEAAAFKPKTEIRIPGLKFSDVLNTVDDEGYIHIPWIGEYVATIYRYGMVVVSIIAFAIVVKKAFDIVLSVGETAEHYKRIGQIFIGLFIMWGSYTLLFYINPHLINFKDLKVKYLEPIQLTERIGGGNEDAPPVSAGTGRKAGGGAGDKDAADLMPCPTLAKGTKFAGAFTTYHNLTQDLYGRPSEYDSTYKGDDPRYKNGLGGSLCAISMECGCPDNAKGGPKICANSKKSWPICKEFDPATTNFCNPKPRGILLAPNATVAASSCFPIGTKIKVGDTVLTVADRGCGIIGTHFDLFQGTKGTDDYPADTSWLKSADLNNIEIVEVPAKPISDKERDHLRKCYNGYKSGVCTPGKNC